jgi:predicted transcriptional regulator
MIETMPRPAGAPVDESKYRALTVRLPAELVDQIKSIAEAEERSINYVAARLLRKALSDKQR